MSEYFVGAKASQEFFCSEESIDAFALATGDKNPIHIDRDTAVAAGFSDRIAHGMWTAGLISSVIATALPGPGSIYLTQNLSFKAPVLVGDRITVAVEITEISGRKFSLTTRATNQLGDLVVEGEALILYRAPAN